VADGVDMIATDHAPHSHDEKHRDDIWTADCGFTGVQTQMPLMLSQVVSGRMTITQYVKMTSLAPPRPLVSIRARRAAARIGRGYRDRGP
jgi:dihydroorotase